MPRICAPRCLLALFATFVAALPAMPRSEELPEGCAGAFRVDNRSSRTIRSIFVSGTTASDDDYRDRLDEGVLPPGLALTFRYAQAPLIDLTVVRDDGRRIERRGIDICRLPFLMVTDAGITLAARPGGF